MLSVMPADGCVIFGLQRNSVTSDCSGDTIAVHLSDVVQRQLFTKTGYYKVDNSLITRQGR